MAVAVVVLTTGGLLMVLSKAIGVATMITVDDDNDDGSHEQPGTLVEAGDGGSEEQPAP